MKNFYDEQSNGCYQNLISQVDSIMKNCTEGSIKTRYRYEAATERFCAFLADEYKLQKFENVKSKHIVAYAEHLKAEGKSASTIKTDLAGIRYFHSHSGSKNVLIDNSKLQLEQRQFTKVDRAWTASEISNAKVMALEMGRADVANAINLSSTCGLRLEEVARCTVAHLVQALDSGTLYVKGKGGKERWVQITGAEQKQALSGALQYAKHCGRTGQDKVLCDNIRGSVQQEKRSIQNWISNHESKFRDQNRTETSGKKIKVNHLNYHGTRAYYANTIYQQALDKYNGNIHQAKRYTSNQLGHEREEVTNIYIS